MNIPAPAANIESEIIHKQKGLPAYWYLDLLLVFVILIGGYFRFTGIRWDENQHLHPDERFLTMVENDIEPVQSIGDYFDTQNSSLNPHNRGHGFYVYGTLPIFIVRYLAEWTGQTGYDQVNLLGRQVSAIFDLFTLILVYLLGAKLYDKRIGLLASLFFAFTVMQIQISHFFAVDTFVCFFTTLSIYFAVKVQKGNDFQEEIKGNQGLWLLLSAHWQEISNFLLFGVALGLAMASKVSAAPIAILLQLAALSWFLKLNSEGKRYWIIPLLRNLVLAALMAFLVFRIFQPYAFNGPGFFNISPNQDWLDDLRELSGQTSGAADFPPALQWARRPATFALENLVRWGMGIPLGLLSWAGFLLISWRMIKKDWSQHIIIWLWTALYFGWQSQIWNPSMRYMVLVYPTLVIMGAWLIFYLWDKAKGKLYGRYIKTLSISLAFITVVASGLWAFAFTRIYNREVTRIEASRWIYQNIPGPINLHIQTSAGEYNQPLPYPQDMVVGEARPANFNFTANTSGEVNEVFVYHLLDTTTANGDKNFTIQLVDNNDGDISTSKVTAEFNSDADTDGSSYLFELDVPFEVQQGNTYQIALISPDGGSEFTFKGSSLANESDWDDGLPLRLDNYDGFGGIYQGHLNFQMYWEENEEKRERFITNLDQADFILISSNRQWATTVRIPERYPLATLYYQELMGCPIEKDLLWCYEVAEPGMFTGQLGYELVNVFQSDPNLGSLKINDQSAEEAFTVYDHPKVFIFRKSDSYDTEKVHSLFESVDLAKVIHVPLNEVPMHPQDLMLPGDRLARQQSGGSWSDLFDINGLMNKYPFVSLVIWYLSIGLLGLMVFPFIRLAFPGLKDRGYAFSRLAGLMIFALISWWVGSVGIPVSRWTLVGVLVLIALLNIILALRTRKELAAFFRENKKHILITEAVFLTFFVLDLLIRIGNPDLWHPSKGGEKPMDFSYLNAVIKSSTFPPYDPWFAGGYINYYYYGYVIVGLPVKLLGIMPSIAYNLILPTFFGMLAIGMFSIVWNVIVQTSHHSLELSTDAQSEAKIEKPSSLKPYIFALAGASGLVLLGNLGTVRMIWHGLMRLAASGGDILTAAIFQRIGWTFQGLVAFFKGAQLPYGWGDWYWIPSRAIPALNDVEPITEFPFFTFLYADLHAHMIALPITVFVLGWVISLILSQGQMEGERSGQQVFSLAATLFIGATAIGALKPTNTWDFPVFLTVGLLAIFYVSFHWLADLNRYWQAIPILRHALLRLAILLASLVGLSLLLYHPFTAWYGAGYNAVELWKGTHTPIWSYITHWGVFIFFIVSWMAGETIDWMAETPLRFLGRLRPFLWLVKTIVFLLIALVALLLYLGAGISWFVLPLTAWAGVLILRSGLPDIKRIVMFFIGTGLVLTLFVEVMVLKGDIGRMNTVFKFYLQVWTLFSLSAALSAWWIYERMIAARMRWGTVYKAVAGILLIGALMFPITAGMAKIKDRYVVSASHSLDGMNYMLGATYGESGETLELGEDLDAIRWMLTHVQGSPVIVEGNVSEYRWGSRYTIYTGLPGVVGWNWHQRQQRAVTPPEWVTSRVEEIGSFYSTTSVGEALQFLRKYNVRYIIVGQLEQAIYPTDGLAKFYQTSDVPWNAVYLQGRTTILEVEPE